MDTFTDPPEAKEIIDKLDSFNDKKDFQNYIEEIFPGWLVYTLDSYSPDYPHLQQNWLHLCKLNNVNPQKIVLVSDIIFDKDHTVLKHCCELMTIKGYVVRRIGEFTVCNICNKAIPCKEIWNFLKNNNAIAIPSIWSYMCSIHEE